MFGEHRVTDTNTAALEKVRKFEMGPRALVARYRASIHPNRMNCIDDPNCCRQEALTNLSLFPRWVSNRTMICVLWKMPCVPKWMNNVRIGPHWGTESRTHTPTIDACMLRFDEPNLIIVFFLACVEVFGCRHFAQASSTGQIRFYYIRCTHCLPCVRERELKRELYKQKLPTNITNGIRH